MADNNRESETSSENGESLELSCSSSIIEESDNENTEAGVGITPYQFEPYEEEEEMAPSETESDSDGDNEIVRLGNTNWYGFVKPNDTILRFTTYFLWSTHRTYIFVIQSIVVH